MQSITSPMGRWFFLFITLALTGIGGTAFTQTVTRLEAVKTENIAEGLAESSSFEKLGTAYSVVEPAFHSSSLLVGTSKGLFIRDDTGQSWTRLAINKQFPPVFAVAQNPQADNIFFAGTRNGLWKTEDGGKRWVKIKKGLPTAFIPRALAFCAYSTNHVYMGTERHGVFRSFDEGNTWVPMNQGLPEALVGGRIAPIKSLLVHPNDGDIAFIGTELAGIYKTMDGGETWKNINVGLPRLITRRTYPPRLAINPDGSTLYTIMGIPIHSRLIRTALYRSTDGGESWRVMETRVPPNITVLSLRVDPADSDSLYIRSLEGDFKVSSTTVVQSKQVF